MKHILSLVLVMGSLSGASLKAMEVGHPLPQAQAAPSQRVSRPLASSEALAAAIMRAPMGEGKRALTEGFKRLFLIRSQLPQHLAGKSLTPVQVHGQARVAVNQFVQEAAAPIIGSLPDFLEVLITSLPTLSNAILKACEEDNQETPPPPRELCRL